jgi:hypothetical protein
MSDKLFNEDDVTSGNNWQEEWKGMPEFVQEDLTSYKSIKVHFRNEDDLQAFAKLINQKITPKQKACWYPFLPNRLRAHLWYIQESDQKNKPAP